MRFASAPRQPNLPGRRQEARLPSRTGRSAWRCCARRWCAKRRQTAEAPGRCAAWSQNARRAVRRGRRAAHPQHGSRPPGRAQPDRSAYRTAHPRRRARRPAARPARQAPVPRAGPDRRDRGTDRCPATHTARAAIRPPAPAQGAPAAGAGRSRRRSIRCSDHTPVRSAARPRPPARRAARAHSVFPGKNTRQSSSPYMRFQNIPLL